MKLEELLSHYLQRHPFGVSAGHAEQLRYSISAWQRRIDRPLTTSDLTDEQLNTYLDSLRATHAPDTVRTRKGNLLILWNHAWQHDLVSQPPCHVRRLRPICRMPIAWTLKEVKSLVAVAEGLTGTFHGGGVRRAPWWSSLIRAGYDTALRLGDLLSMKACDVHAEMQLWQRKTTKPVVVRLRPATLAAINQTLSDESRPVIWHLWASRQTFFEHFRALVTLAGIRSGTFRWLRRSAITQIETISHGAGTLLAGHASRATTEQWYLDRSQLQGILPPW